MIKTLSVSLLSFLSGIIFMYIRQEVPMNMTNRQLLEEVWQRFSLHIICVSVYLSLIHLVFMYKAMRWFFRISKKYVEIVHSDASTIVGSVSAPLYEPEKFVAGSEYFAHPRPSFMVQLYAQTNPTTWSSIGCGWRMQDYLVTALHVVADQSIIRVKAGDKHVDVDSSRFGDYGADCAVCLLDKGDWTSLAVKSAKIPKMAASSSSVVFAHSDGVASSGLLEPYHIQPYVVYQGSTKPGFSGTPLYVGSTVYAMHVGAGKVNMALDANWIKAVSFKAESSEDWVYEEIERQYKRGKVTKYNSFTPGEAFIMVGGSYHILDFQDIPDHVHAMLEFESAADKYAAESSSVTPNITFSDKHLNLRRAPAVAEARQLKAGKSVLKPSGVEVLKPSGSQMPPAEAVMDGQELMLAQLSKALLGISKSPTKSPRNVTRKSRSRTRKPRYRSDSRC